MGLNVTCTVSFKLVLATEAKIRREFMYACFILDWKDLEHHAAFLVELNARRKLTIRLGGLAEAKFSIHVKRLRHYKYMQRTASKPTNL